MRGDAGQQIGRIRHLRSLACEAEVLDKGVALTALVEIDRPAVAEPIVPADADEGPLPVSVAVHLDGKRMTSAPVGSHRGGRATDFHALALLPGLYGTVKVNLGRLREYLELATEEVRAADQTGDRLFAGAVRLDLVFANRLLGRLSDALTDAEAARALLPDDPTAGRDIYGVSVPLHLMQYRVFTVVPVGRHRPGAEDEELPGHAEGEFGIARGDAEHFEYVIPNHDGEDSDAWEAFYYPLGEARRAFVAVVALLRGVRSLPGTAPEPTAPCGSHFASSQGQP